MRLYLHHSELLDVRTSQKWLSGHHKACTLSLSISVSEAGVYIHLELFGHIDRGIPVSEGCVGVINLIILATLPRFSAAVATG